MRLQATHHRFGEFAKVMVIRAYPKCKGILACSQTLPPSQFLSVSTVAQCRFRTPPQCRPRRNIVDAENVAVSAPARRQSRNGSSAAVHHAADKGVAKRQPCSLTSSLTTQQRTNDRQDNGHPLSLLHWWTSDDSTAMGSLIAHSQNLSHFAIAQLRYVAVPTLDGAKSLVRVVFIAQLCCSE